MSLVWWQPVWGRRWHGVRSHRLSLRSISIRNPTLTEAWAATASPPTPRLLSTSAVRPPLPQLKGLLVKQFEVLPSLRFSFFLSFFFSCFLSCLLYFIVFVILLLLLPSRLVGDDRTNVRAQVMFVSMYEHRWWSYQCTNTGDVRINVRTRVMIVSMYEHRLEGLLMKHFEIYCYLYSVGILVLKAMV